MKTQILSTAYNYGSMSTHVHIGNDIVFTDNGSDSETDIGWLFSDGNVPFNIIPDVYSALGLLFHAMQQTGGTLLFKGLSVAATTMEQTSGLPLCSDTKVTYDVDSIVELGSLIDNDPIILADGLV